MIFIYLTFLSLVVGLAQVVRLLTVTTPPLAVSDSFLEFFVGIGATFAQVSNALNVDVSVPFSLLSPMFYVFFTLLVLRFASFSVKRGVLLAVMFGLVSIIF